jgi:hypothetical protein
LAKGESEEETTWVERKVFVSSEPNDFDKSNCTNYSNDELFQDLKNDLQRIGCNDKEILIRITR